jgi:hypothetical protein
VTGFVTSPPEQQQDRLELRQQDDGIHWNVEEQRGVSSKVAADWQKLKRRHQYGSIVFYAHPSCHGIPWSVLDSIANQHVGKVLKNQPFKELRSEAPGDRRIATSSPWQAAGMEQTPKQVWEPRNEITAYQVWVAYRVSVRQLNSTTGGRQLLKTTRMSRAEGDHRAHFLVLWLCEATWWIVIAQWT